jgi:hypothetical protein
LKKAFELQWDPGKARVMTTKYCVKYRLGKCAVSKQPWVKKSGTVDFKTWRKQA